MLSFSKISSVSAYKLNVKAMIRAENKSITVEFSLIQENEEACKVKEHLTHAVSFLCLSAAS